MQQSSEISQIDIPRGSPYSVSFSSSDPGIAASVSEWQPHPDEKDPDASVIHVSSNADDTFTITRTGGTMFGIPVTPFSVSTSSVLETRWFLEHIRAFHEFLERAKHQDHGGAVLNIFERTGDAIGADLVVREDAAGFRYVDGFQPKLLYLNPENYEISEWSDAEMVLSVGKEQNIGHAPTPAFRFDVPDGFHEDSAFMLLLAVPPGPNASLTREALISGRANKLVMPDDYTGGRLDLPEFLTASLVGFTIRLIEPAEDDFHR